MSEQGWEDFASESDILEKSHVSGAGPWVREGRRVELLWWRLLRVSAASMSSADIPDRTEAALVERSRSVMTRSMSIEPCFRVSVEDRWAERGGEKGGGSE